MNCHEPPWSWHEFRSSAGLAAATACTTPAPYPGNGRRPPCGSGVRPPGPVGTPTVGRPPPLGGGAGAGGVLNETTCDGADSFEPSVPHTRQKKLVFHGSSPIVT